MNREFLPCGFKSPNGIWLGLEHEKATRLARRAGEMCDWLYDLGTPESLEAAEMLDVLLEEFIEAITDRLEYLETESWNMTGSCNPEGETGIEDYEMDETFDDVLPGVGEYWEPHMLVACDDGSFHGLAA